MIADDARLLTVLHHASAHVSWEETGLSPAALVAALERLRAAGFDIENRPTQGLRLLSAPDRLLADDLVARLGGRLPLGEILVFEETASTNDVAARMGREGCKAAVVFAERQTAGRGRFGRRWDSQSHAGLWFSLLLRPAMAFEYWPQLTTMAGVAVARAVVAEVQQEATIKWPNDVLVSGRKVCGILIESATDEAGQPFAVVGIGINVNQETFPEEITTVATSLRLLCGKPVVRPAFAATILSSLATIFAQGMDDFEPVLQEARRRSAVLGHWVRLRAGEEQVEGTAEDFDAMGALQLRLKDGTLRVMNAGEVTSRGR